MESATRTGSKNAPLDAGRDSEMDLASSETSRGKIVGGDRGYGGIRDQSTGMLNPSPEYHKTYVYRHMQAVVCICQRIMNRTTPRQPVSNIICTRSLPKTSILLLLRSNSPRRCWCEWLLHPRRRLHKLVMFSTPFARA